MNAEEQSKLTLCQCLPKPTEFGRANVYMVLAANSGEAGHVLTLNLGSVNFNAGALEEFRGDEGMQRHWNRGVRCMAKKVSQIQGYIK